MKTVSLKEKFSEDTFGELVRHLNTFFRSIGLENFDGQIIENISIPASTSIRIPHNLKSIPKYRIIIDQINGGTIIRGDDEWTETSISLKNSGGTDTIISVFIFRS